MRQIQPKALLCALIITLMTGFATVPHAHAKSPAKAAAKAEQRAQITARDAAAKAKSQHGGKVLKVSKQGNGYKVKLLQDSGRVVTVTVQD